MTKPNIIAAPHYFAAADAVLVGGFLGATSTIALDPDPQQPAH